MDLLYVTPVVNPSLIALLIAGRNSRPKIPLDKQGQRVYDVSMLTRHNVFLDSKDLKVLATIGQAKGGLKVAQMIRLAIAEYIKREERKAQ